MIMNKKNKKFSRNRKRRIERKFGIDDNLKTFLNKTEKKKKSRTFDKNKELETQLVKIKYVNNPNKLQSQIKEFNKIQVIGENLHETRNEILLDYVGELKIGNLKIDDQI